MKNVVVVAQIKGIERKLSIYKMIRLLIVPKKVKETTADEDKDGTKNNTKVKIIIKAVLGYAALDNNNCKQYAISIDSYWSQIKQQPPLQ